MPELPKVVCKTATFGRPELLNEAVASFLKQDYVGPKELMILNDCPAMEYVFDHPEVTVINRSCRFPTLGDKFNYQIEAMNGDIIMNWPDDDIMLPWAISTVVENMERTDVFAGKGYWYMEAGRLIRLETHHCAGVLSFTKNAWREAGRYASMNSGEDQDFLARLKGACLVEFTQLSRNDAFFIYRWLTGCPHLSGFGRGNQGYEILGQQVMSNIEQGIYVIEPRWNADYIAVVAEQLD